MPFGDGAYGVFGQNIPPDKPRSEPISQAYVHASDQVGPDEPLETKGDLSFSIRLEDGDWAMYDWFTIHEPIRIEDKQVVVIFSTRERWAYEQNVMEDMMRSQRDFNDAHDPISDQVNLPQLSIVRAEESEILERSIPGDAEGVTSIKFLRAVSTTPDGSNLTPYTLSGDTAVYETIEIQPPTWVKCSYDVVAWTGNMDDMNVIKEHIIGKFRQFHAIKDESKGTRYAAMLESVSTENNSDDYGNEDRIFKSTFRIDIELPLLEGSRQTQYSRTLRYTNITTETTLTPKEAASFQWRSPYDKSTCGPGRDYNNPIS